ncbi:hypothetical protein SEA_RICKROSS_26 [Streptomyces phage RickRoss]|nr:hypothetical protein SEA_RICKROSS_26 [Streptomyces phage RickRoss]
MAITEHGTSDLTHVHDDDCRACAEELRNMRKEIHEIHSFLSGIATALKSPMLAAMLPPQMRNMLP